MVKRRREIQAKQIQPIERTGIPLHFHESDSVAEFDELYSNDNETKEEIN